MHKRTVSVLSSIILAMAAGTAGAADSDSKVSREREMLRRAQEALRQSQADNSELSRAKLDAEQKLKAATEQLASGRNASKSAQASLRTQLQNAADTQAELTRQLEAAKQQFAALSSKQQETAARLSARELELKQTQQDLQSSKTADASCEAKNLKLYEYSQDLVKGYEKKGVWAALTQKEPVLGFKEVGIENVVQEYREKLASQKIASPAVATSTPAAASTPTPPPAAPPTSTPAR